MELGEREVVRWKLQVDGELGVGQTDATMELREERKQAVLMVILRMGWVDLTCRNWLMLAV